MLTRNLAFLHNQLADKKLAVNTDEPTPPADSFFFRVFNKNLSVAESVLGTSFLQAMKKNDLPPLNFGVMNVQDAYYCYRAEETYQTLLSVIDPADELMREMRALVEDNFNGYKEYNQTFFDTWRIPTASSVNPTEVFINYAEHEHHIACSCEPIYTLVAMLPCYYLWYWFCSKMYPEMSSNNLYRDWVEGSLSTGSAYRIGNFIDKWQKNQQPFDEERADEIYAASMNYELQVFTEAYRPNVKLFTRGGI